MTEPISIFDLKRKQKPVALNGGEHSLIIYGLTAQEICDHLERFPTLAQLSIGGTLSAMDAIRAVPGASSAWIASALGQHKNEAAEKAATENLTIEDAAFVIDESLGLTFSRGFGPFVARLTVLLQHLTVGPGKDRDTRSPTRSAPPSPPPGSIPIGPGVPPPDSSPPTSSSPSADG